MAIAKIDDSMRLLNYGVVIFFTVTLVFAIDQAFDYWKFTRVERLMNELATLLAKPTSAKLLPKINAWEDPEKLRQIAVALARWNDEKDVQIQEALANVLEVSRSAVYKLCGVSLIGLMISCYFIFALMRAQKDRHQGRFDDAKS
jgi:predicted ferric reductase